MCSLPSEPLVILQIGQVMATTLVCVEEQCSELILEELRTMNNMVRYEHIDSQALLVELRQLKSVLIDNRNLLRKLSSGRRVSLTPLPKTRENPLELNY